MKRTPIQILLLLAATAALAVAEDTANAPVAAKRTVITSDTLEMQGSGDRNHFYFRDNVHVVGTNLEIRCDELTVVAGRGGDDEATIGEIGAIESIVAVGNVEIHQAGRSAYAGRAEVDPQEGTVTLSQNPRIVDGEVEVEGFMFVLYKDQKTFKSIPDPFPSEGKPSRSVVRLGELPDLGFDQPEEEISVTDLTDRPDRSDEPANAPEADE